MKSILCSLIIVFATAAASAHDVQLSWTASAAVPGVTVAGYNVYHGTKTGGPYTKSNTALITPGVTFDDTTVIGGTKYFYVVTAVSTTGVESGFSTEISVTVPLAAPNGLGGKVTILINGGSNGDGKTDNQHSSRDENPGSGGQRNPQQVVPEPRSFRRYKDCGNRPYCTALSGAQRV